jgi:hypothetical protein
MRRMTRQIILVAFLVPMIHAVPCRAVVEPHDVLSIDGTAWKSADPDPLSFAFYNGTLYVDCQWMGQSEDECENPDLVPIDSVIREPGRIGFSIHFSTPVATHIFRFEVLDLEENSGYMEGWYIELWPWRPNAFFLFAPDVIEGDRPFGIGIYRHYAYGSSWEATPPIFLFKVEDSWVPPAVE